MARELSGPDCDINRFIEIDKKETTREFGLRVELQKLIVSEQNDLDTDTKRKEVLFQFLMSVAWTSIIFVITSTVVVAIALVFYIVRKPDIDIQILGIFVDKTRVVSVSVFANIIAIVGAIALYLFSDRHRGLRSELFRFHTNK